MKKRSIGLMILLWIFTFGIYPLYWYISFQCELKSATGDGFGGLGHFLCSIFTFGIYPLYWQLAAGNRLAKQGASNLGVLYLVFCFIALMWLNPFLMQSQANGIAKQ